MLIRLNTAVAGATFAYSPGEVLDWQPDAEARTFCERGQAEPLSAEDVKGQKVRRHKPPLTGPDDAWPPKRPERQATRKAAVAR